MASTPGRGPEPDDAHQDQAEDQRVHRTRDVQHALGPKGQQPWRAQVARDQHRQRQGHQRRQQRAQRRDLERHPGGAGHGGQEAGLDLAAVLHPQQRAVVAAVLQALGAEPGVEKAGPRKVAQGLDAGCPRGCGQS
jgi:hypothetical protein